MEVNNDVVIKVNWIRAEAKIATGSSEGLVIIKVY
jgi:hypothetical protein